MAKKDFNDLYLERLERIINLKEKGAISEKEFQREKKKLEKQKKAHNNPLGAIIGVILILVILGAFFVWLFSGNPGEQKKQVSKPDKYSAQVVSSGVVDPAIYRVVAKITNTGDVAWEEPSCSIKVENVNGTYQGYDTFNIPETLMPGQEYVLTANLTVTNQGSSYVTKYNVKCQ